MAYERLEFQRVEGRDVPLQPWPQKFFVSKEVLAIGGVEVRPLTVMGLVKGVGQNFVTMNWWRLHRLLWRVGFLATKEGEAYSLRKHWRWTFWRAREI